MDPGAIQNALHERLDEAATIADRLHAARRLAGAIEIQRDSELRSHILHMVVRVGVHEDRVEVHVSRAALHALGGDGSDAASPSDPVIISFPAARARVGKDVRLVIGPAPEQLSGRRDAALIKLIVKAHAARLSVEASGGRSIEELARAQGHTGDYFRVLLRLSYLAPDITSAILDGRQPVTLARQRLARCSIPLGWGEQRKALGFC